MDNSFKIQGIYHERLDDITFNSGGKKGEFVLELLNEMKDGKTWRDYPKFEVVEKFMTIMDGVDVGDTVIVDFSIGGRKWRPEGSDVDKYFGTMKAWDIKVVKKASGEDIPHDVNDTMNLNADDDPFDGVFDDDPPF